MQLALVLCNIDLCPPTTWKFIVNDSVNLIIKIQKSNICFYLLPPPNLLKLFTRPFTKNPKYTISGFFGLCN